MNPFPMDPILRDAALHMYDLVTPAIMSLVGLAFFMRIAYAGVTFQGASIYGTLIREVLCCLILIAAFPTLFQIILDSSTQLASLIAPHSLIQARELSDFPRPSIFGGDSQSFFKELIFWILSFSFHIARFIFSILLGILASIAPIAIFSATMLNLVIGLPIYFTLLITTALWPFLWNLVGVFTFSILESDVGGHTTTSQVAKAIYTTLMSLIQILAPYIVGKVLTGQSPGQAISQAAKSAAKFVATAAMGPKGMAVAGVASAKMGSALASGGSAALTTAGKMGSRMQSAQNAFRFKRHLQSSSVKADVDALDSSSRYSNRPPSTTVGEDLDQEMGWRTSSRPLPPDLTEGEEMDRDMNWRMASVKKNSPNETSTSKKQGVITPKNEMGRSTIGDDLDREMNRRTSSRKTPVSSTISADLDREMSRRIVSSKGYSPPIVDTLSTRRTISSENGKDFTDL